MSMGRSVALVLISLMLFLGCQRGAIIEGPADEAGRPEAVEGEGQTSAESEAAREREQIEASLKTKTYAGIEGEVLESSMLEDVHFAFDRYDLNARAREILARNAEFILKFPEAEIQIEGHCDERGTAEYNLALGERRAMSTRQYLVSLGVPANRLSRISYGEELPVDPQHNEQAWAKNRRGHFVILSR